MLLPSVIFELAAAVTSGVSQCDRLALARSNRKLPIGVPSCGGCDGSFRGSVRPPTPKGHRKHRLP